MSLTFAELESVTNDYFMADGGKAVDIYFDDSWLMTYGVEDKKGIWERPDGGEHIRIPLEYDEQVSGWYVRGDTISSDDRESINAARFEWRHCYGNATVRRIDELKNSGEYAEVKLVTQRLSGAQKTITKLIADSLYDAYTGSSNRLDGLRACCSETSTDKYGNIAEDDLVAADGTKPWEGITTTTSESISLAVLRTMASGAKIRSGKGGKPDIIVTTETLWNEVADLLEVQQRFKEATEVADAGFTGLIFEGKKVVADDYVPSGYAFGINTNYWGFAVHKNGLFMRTKWKVIPDSPEDRSLKIYFDGNQVVSNRKSIIAHSNLS